jgi:hypothetical protein
MAAAFGRLHFPTWCEWHTERRARREQKETHTTCRSCSRVVLAFALPHPHIVPFIGRRTLVFFSVIVILIREAHFKRSRASCLRRSLCARCHVGLLEQVHSPLKWPMEHRPVQFQFTIASGPGYCTLTAHEQAATTIMYSTLQSKPVPA